MQIDGIKIAVFPFGLSEYRRITLYFDNWPVAYFRPYELNSSPLNHRARYLSSSVQRRITAIGSTESGVARIKDIHLKSTTGRVQVP